MHPLSATWQQTL